MNTLLNLLVAMSIVAMLAFTGCDSATPIHPIAVTPGPNGLLSGNGLSALLGISASEIDFGSRSINSVNYSPLQITNSTTGTASQITVKGFTGAVGFRDSTDAPCANGLTAKASCTLLITYLPVSVQGTDDQMLTVQYFDGNAHQSLPLRVTGTGSGVVELQILDPANLFSATTNFPALVNGAKAISYTFQVRYAGDPAKGATGVNFNQLKGALSVQSTTCKFNQSADCSVTVGINSNQIGIQKSLLTVTYDNYAQVDSSTQNLVATTTAVPVVPVTPYASLAFQNSDGNFGKRLINHSFTSLFTIVNNGNANAFQIGGTISGSAFAFTGNQGFPGAKGTCQTTLTPGSNCKIEVQFATSSAASTSSVTGSLVVNYLNGNTSNATLALQGSSGNPASLTVQNPGGSTTSPFDMGAYSVGYTTSSTFILINDPLSVAAQVSSLSVAQNTPFWISWNNCTGSIASGSSCMFNVGFKPLSASGNQVQTFASSIAANYSDSDTSTSPSSHSLSDLIQGEGKPDALLIFGGISGFNQPVNTSVSQTVTVLYFGTVSAQNVLSSGLSGYFSASPGGSAPCGGSVSANCTMVVTYSPTVVESNDNQTLTLNYGNGLGGSGPAANLGVVGSSYIPTADLTFNQGGNYSFGNVAASAAASSATFSLTLSGTASSVGSATATLSGTNANAFTIGQNTCSGTVNAPGCSISVSTNLPNSGSYSAVLTLNYTGGAPNRGSASINLSATNLATLSLSGNGSFGKASLNSPAASQVFTVTNTGKAVATVNYCTSSSGAVQTPQAPFNIVANSCNGGGSTAFNLNVGSSCNVTVQFNFSAVGNRGDSLCLAYTGTASQVAVGLSGAGTQGALMKAGGNHTCLTNDVGQLYCLGDNARGELGLGDTNSRGLYSSQLGSNLPSVPLPLATNEWIVELALGGFHTCVRTNLGNVYCFGANDSGQLGNGNNSGSMVTVGDQPNQVAQLQPVNLGGNAAISIGAGYAHTCAVVTNGQLYCWGNNNFGQLGRGDDVNVGGNPSDMGANLVAVPLSQPAVAVALDTGHTGAMLKDGSVVYWGYNDYGQLGQGNQTTIGNQAGQLAALPMVALGTHAAAQIAAGGGFSGVLDKNGQIVLWGHNFSALLGQQWCTSPTGGFGSCANGYSTALSGYGDHAEQMGKNLVPVNLGSGVVATQLAAGNNFNCAVTKDNSGVIGVKCWGDNDSGQLGVGNNVAVDPSQLGNTFPAVDLGGAIPAYLSVGNSHACVLTNSNAVLCWGNNQYGQLGVGTTQNVGDQSGEMGSALVPASF